MSFESLRLMWLLLSPGNLLLIVGGLGVLFACTPWRWLGRFLLGLTALAVVGMLYTPFVPRVIKLLEDRFPPPLVMPATVDGILVLGGAEVTDPALARDLPADIDLQARQARMLALMGAYPKAKIVYAGAPADPEQPQPGEMADLRGKLGALGVDPGRMIWVTSGGDTFESLIFAYDRVKPQPGQTWLLVTSAWNLPRAMGVAQRQHWKLIPQPVAELTGITIAPPERLGLGLLLAERAMREWSALTLYAMVEHTDHWVPAPTD